MVEPAVATRERKSLAAAEMSVAEFVPLTVKSGTDSPPSDPDRNQSYLVDDDDDDDDDD